MPNVLDALFVGRGLMWFSVPRLVNITFLVSLQSLRDLCADRAAVTGMRSLGPGVEIESELEPGQSGQRIGAEPEPGPQRMMPEPEVECPVESNPDTKIEVNSG